MEEETGKARSPVIPETCGEGHRNCRCTGTEGIHTYDEKGQLLGKLEAKGI